METSQILQCLILFTGIVGQILVAHRNTKGFYWWLGCNAAALYASIANGLYGMAALYVFYSVMCFYSIWKWKKLDSLKLSTKTSQDSVLLDKVISDRV